MMTAVSVSPRSAALAWAAAFRSRRGTPPTTAKLTPALVSAMRAERAQGATVTEIAERYGVSKACASRTLRGLNWSQVA